MDALLMAARDEARRAQMHEWFWPARALALRGFMGVWPALPVGDTEWQPLDWRACRATQIRVILPVLMGEPAGGYGPDIERNAHGIARFDVRTDVEELRRGRILIDLLAFSPAMDRPPRRLVGIADALGPQPEMAECRDAPVRLARDIAEWFALLPQAPVLLLGSADKRAQTLRRYTCGVVCSDLAHGEAMERLSRRPVPAPPKILVAA